MRIGKILIAAGAMVFSGPAVPLWAEEPKAGGYGELSRYYLERQPTGWEALSYNMLTALASAQQGDGDLAMAAVSGAKQSINYFFDPALGAGLPEWVKRIEFEWELRENAQPEFSLLTVQPLYQDDAKTDTVFTQIGLVRQQQFGDPRHVANLGLGYRRLMMDNRVLLGANTFYDYEFDNGHRRLGLGAEAKIDSFDLTYNQYFGIGGKTDVGDGNFEEVLDGWDIEVRSQVPYLPWARVGLKRYQWDTKANSEDITGHALSMELALLRNIDVELSVQDDNTDDRLVHLATRFHPAAEEGKATVASSAFVSTRFFEHRDLSNETLAKIRRENRIVVERTGSGVVISRGN